MTFIGNMVFAVVMLGAFAWLCNIVMTRAERGEQ